MSCSERLRPAYCGLLRLALWLALCVPGAHAADALEIVIVSASAGNVATLERGIAEQLYLGQRSQLADGHQITVIDLPAGAIRDHFYRTLTGKKPSQIRAYWSRLVYRTRPPSARGHQRRKRDRADHRQPGRHRLSAGRSRTAPRAEGPATAGLKARRPTACATRRHRPTHPFTASAGDRHGGRAMQAERIERLHQHGLDDLMRIIPVLIRLIHARFRPSGCRARQRRHRRALRQPPDGLTPACPHAQRSAARHAARSRDRTRRQPLCAARDTKRQAHPDEMNSVHFDCPDKRA